MAESSGPGDAKDNGVTKRAILLALFLIVLLAPAGFYLELVTKLAYNFNTMVPPITPLGLLFLVAALNPLYRRLKRPLSRSELLVVYILLTIGAPLVAHGTLLWFLSCSFGWQYYARTSPQWETAFFQFVPGWFYPPDWVAAEGFFQGRAPVPWAQWWPPLAAWGSFFIALFMANLFALLLFRPQWITHERLSFPIAQVPLETVHDGPGGRGRLPVAKMFWAGFGIATFLNLQYRMPTIIPSLPSISLGEYMLVAWQKVGPLAGLGDIWMVLYPWCIALAYLIPKELSFSVWFFYLVRVALCVLAIAAGATPRKPEEWYGTVFPAPYFQGGGAVLAIGLLALWTGRRGAARLPLGAARPAALLRLSRPLLHVRRMPLLRRARPRRPDGLLPRRVGAPPGGERHELHRVPLHRGRHAHPAGRQRRLPARRDRDHVRHPLVLLPGMGGEL
jgi:hypothetical protein